MIQGVFDDEKCDEKAHQIQKKKMMGKNTALTNEVIDAKIEICDKNLRIIKLESDLAKRGIIIDEIRHKTIKA